MSPIDRPAIPRSSIVLVTGVNGFLGSHIADKFLQFGYRVRGTTRNPDKNAWMSKLFDNKFGVGKFELVQVMDMETPGAYDKVVKGILYILLDCVREIICINNAYRSVSHCTYGDKLHNESQPTRSDSGYYSRHGERVSCGFQGAEREALRLDVLVGFSIDSKTEQPYHGNNWDLE